MKKKILYRTIIQVEILSEDPIPEEGVNLQTIYDNITDGPWSGLVSTVVDNFAVVGELAVMFTKEHGTDPEFFQMDANGNELEL